MSNLRATSERSVAQIATRQHGVVTTAQLAAAGLDKFAIQYRVKAGRLHRLHRGVYAVGHTRLSFEGRCLAAALACGRSAAVSHRSAATVWRFLPPSPGPIEVSVPGPGGRRQRRGITVHRAATLEAGQVTRRFGVPVTRPLRTLRDIHRTAPKRFHQRAVRRALDLGLVASSDLGPNPDLTRSELERRFLLLCRRHRLPEPDVNVQVGGFEVDFLWREARLVVETDGFRHHGDRMAFERDRARDVQIQTLGYRVLRFTHRQLRDSPAEIAGVLRRVIQRRA